MSQQQTKQGRQNSVSALHRQGQNHGHRKNYSSQLDSKDLEGSPKIGKELKYLFTPSRVSESPYVKKGQPFYDNKSFKQNTSMSNLRSIINKSSSISHLSPNSQNFSSTQNSNKQVVASSQSNKNLLSTGDNNAYLNINIIPAQNQQIKEQEIGPLSPIEEIHINNVKKTTPFASFSQSSKRDIQDIPRSTLNFNLDSATKQLANQISNQMQGAQGQTNNQGKGQDLQQQGVNKLQQQQSVGQLNNYYSKSSYNMPQQNITPSTTAVNTQSISNINNKTNPIMQNFLQQQQQNQQMQNNKNAVQNSNNQFQINLLQSSQQVQQPNLMQINGATLTESQNTQNAQNMNQNLASNQSRQSSITNISNILQNDYINQLKNEDYIQDAKVSFTTQKDQMNSLIGKQQRSVSKEYSIKKEPSTVSLRRKESSSNQNGSRNNSQNQRSSIKYQVQINNPGNSQQINFQDYKKIKQNLAFKKIDDQKQAYEIIKKNHKTNKNFLINYKGKSSSKLIKIIYTFTQFQVELNSHQGEGRQEKFKKNFQPKKFMGIINTVM